MTYLPLKAVLFDLDGTFLDTSQDMAQALNLLLAEHGRAPLPYASIRPQVSHGALGLLNLGFQISPEHTDFASLRARYLDIYEACMFEQTRAFAGIDQLLRYCGHHDLLWGIVTNKPRYLTDKILRHLGYWRHASAIIAGDDLPQRKPHPAPMLKAAELSKVDAAACCYIGDALRDISAGKNAGMRTITARWGFIGIDENTADWQADIEAATPLDVIDIITHWQQQNPTGSSGSDTSAS